MTACSSVLGAVLSKAEVTWGENVATFTTPTRHNVTNPIDLSTLTHDKIEPARVTQYRGEGTEHIPGVMGGGFKMRGHLHGHGSTTAGATAATDFGNFLAWVLGAATTPAAGSTFTGGTAVAPLTIASGTVPTGSLIRGGALGDARAGGQFFATGAHTGTTLNLLTGMTAPPNNADVMWSAETIYTDPTSCAVSESRRFFLPTADQTRIAHGCFPRSFSITQTNPGELPAWEADIGSSWHEPEASLAFPVTTAGDAFNPAPNAAGSLFFAAHGTATRATLDIRAWSIDIQLGIDPVPGIGGVNGYQTIVGVKRQPDKIMVNLVVDAAGASANPTHWAAWLTGGKYHMLYTLNTGTGTAVGIYLSCLRYVGQRPGQNSFQNRNAVNLQFEAYANETVTTSALTLSALRIGLA